MKGMVTFINCAICGVVFEQNRIGQKAVVCGPDCRAEYGRRAMRAKYRAKHGIPNDHAYRKCGYCGTQINHGPTAKKYCSSECAHQMARKLDRDRKRAGVELGGQIKCADCGAVTTRRSGMTKRCEPCQSAWNEGKSRRHRARNLERNRVLATAAAARRRATKDGAEEYRQACRAWRKVPKNRLRGRVTAMMNRCLASGKSGRSWAEIVDYSLDDLRQHLERQFLKGMTWDNMDQWHIDHIVPVAAFEFSSPEDDEFKACWALTNLRPMWAKDNQRKSAKRIFLI